MKQFQADRQTLQKDFEKSQINEEIFIKDIENFLDETNKSDKRRPGRKPALPDSHLTQQELLKRNIRRVRNKMASANGRNRTKNILKEITLKKQFLADRLEEEDFSIEIQMKKLEQLRKVVKGLDKSYIPLAEKNRADLHAKLENDATEQIAEFENFMTKLDINLDFPNLFLSEWVERDPMDLLVFEGLQSEMEIFDINMLLE